MRRSAPLRSMLLPAALACAPAAAMLAVAPFAEDGAHGLFQSDAAALAATAALWAFVARARPRVLGLLALATVPAAGVHLLLGGTPGSLVGWCALLLGVGAAAGGLALLGRRVGAPGVSAAVLATAVPVTAMLGLFWADPLGDVLPQAGRYAFKQAVVHADAATAAAYGAADHDRLHEARVYREVPLATEAVEPPAAVSTGLLWLVVGVLAGGAACGLPRGRTTP